MARDAVLARAAQAGGKDADSLWQKAAATEDTIPFMEQPYWYYPVLRSLGAALLKSGKPEAAKKEFAAALERARAPRACGVGQGKGR